MAHTKLLWANTPASVGFPPELARAILSFVAHEDVPVIGTAVGPRLGAVVATRHCHNEEKMRMLRERGYGDIDIAYSDSTADLPLLLAAKAPVVVNPKPAKVEFFRRVLPAGTRILNWGCVDRGGDKAWGWIKKGVPLRVEVGPRDFAANAVFVARRDTGEKAGIPRAEFVATVVERLQSIQRMVADQLGDKVPDFEADVLRAHGAELAFAAFAVLVIRPIINSIAQRASTGTIFGTAPGASGPPTMTLLLDEDREFGKVSLKDFYRLYWLRQKDPKVKVPRDGSRRDQANSPMRTKEMPSSRIRRASVRHRLSSQCSG